MRRPFEHMSLASRAALSSRDGCPLDETEQRHETGPRACRSREAGVATATAASHRMQQHGRRHGTQDHENRPCHTDGPGRSGLDEDRVGDLGGDVN